jgi:two-component system phosphate regulon response regulator PhoB
VVEDDADIRELLLLRLTDEGFAVELGFDGFEGLEKCLTFRPSLLILDVMLPDMDGLELCRRLRSKAKFKDLPIIILTAMVEEAHRLAGFESGADDYMVKPFSFRELILRVKALLRRSQPLDLSQRDRGKLLTREGLVIDTEAHLVTFKGRSISLTAMEFRLLRYMAERSGRVLERSNLLEDVWGYNEENYARTVDTHMRRLRQKLGEAECLLETVRGVGYRFRAGKAEDS